MRTSEEMFALFHKIAMSDEWIRVLTLEGSRVNPNVTPDPWQDYDITFLVTDVESFRQSDEWLSVFGDRVFLQKPEAMELFADAMSEVCDHLQYECPDDAEKIEKYIGTLKEMTSKNDF